MTLRPDKLITVAAYLALSCIANPIAFAKDPTSGSSSVRLPDWSGWWGQGDLPTKSYLDHPPPLTPEKRKELSQRQPEEIGRGLYCHAPAFAGFNGTFSVNFEFLFTPGRVTIINEGGLVRRIYTDGRKLPANPVPAMSGTSIGHWEGQTLVIETIGISPEAPLARFGPIGKNARIIEHIRLKQKDILESEIETFAPDVFTAVDRRTYLSGRVPGKQMPDEVIYCNERDRSYDSNSGKEQFDMTPPPDLPPPPQE